MVKTIVHGLEVQHWGTPPLAHEDHEQRGDEAEDGGAFGQGAAQQQGAVDLAGGLRLAGDGLAGLTGGECRCRCPRRCR